MYMFIYIYIYKHIYIYIYCNIHVHTHSGERAGGCRVGIGRAGGQVMVGGRKPGSRQQMDGNKCTNMCETRKFENWWNQLRIPINSEVRKPSAACSYKRQTWLKVFFQFCFRYTREVSLLHKSIGERGGIRERSSGAKYNSGNANFSVTDNWCEAAASVFASTGAV